MGSVSPRSLKRLINMHRLAKAILFRDVDLKAGLEAALVVWVMLTWRYCKQLNWWLAVRSVAFYQLRFISMVWLLQQSY